MIIILDYNEVNIMKVLFIYPDITPSIPGYKGSLSFGLISLSAVLKERSISSSLLHLTKKKYEKDELLQKVEEANCDLIAFSAGSAMFHYVVTFSSWIKKAFKNIPILCGGVHPTICPEESIACEGIDMIGIGEGELALAELCDLMQNNKDFRSVRNFWVKDDRKIYKNPVRPLITDLDTLPLYDWDLFEMKSLQDSPEGVGNYLASRGCLFDCSYCANHQIKIIYSGERTIIRYQSVQRVIQEIEILIKKYPFIRYLVFQDDILAKNRTWFTEFAHAFSSIIKIPYMCNARPELLTDATAKLMKSSGCSRAWLGVESGNEEIRKKVLKRNVSQQQLKKAFAILHAHGIATQSFNMIGIPYEDPRKVLETIKLNAEINPTGMQATIFYPYPNSEIYHICKKEGFLTEFSADDYHTKTILQLPTISKSQIEFFKRYFRIVVKLYSILFHHNFYGKTSLLKFLDSLLTSKYFPHALLTNLYQIPLFPVKYLHSRYFQRLYKRRARQFKKGSRL